MSLSPLPKEMPDLLSVYRHKFEGVFDMHRVKTGSPEDLPGFVEKLRTDRYFAMDFWEIARSAGRRGDVSPEKIRETVVQCVGGPGLRDTDPDVLELQKELNGNLSHEAEAIGPVVTAPVAEQDVESSAGGLSPEPEIAPGADEPAYTLGSGDEPEEHTGASPYIGSRHVDDALSRLEINSNALKLQLDEIDSRMSRIEPHIEDLSSRVGISAGLDGATGNSRKPRLDDPPSGTVPVTGQAAVKSAVPKPQAAMPRRAWFEIWGAMLAVATMLLLLGVWLWVLRHHPYPQGLDRTQAASATGIATGPPMIPSPAASVAEPNSAPNGDIASANAPTGAQVNSPGENQAAGSPRATPGSKPSPQTARESQPSDGAVHGNEAAREKTPGEPRATDSDSAVAGDTPDAQNDRSTEVSVASSSPHVARLRARDTTRAAGWKQGIRVSSGVMATNLIESQPPNYPRLAKLTHIQGPVVLQVFISKDGTVDHVNAVKGHRLLRGAAKNAVQRWRYRPYLVNGRPVEVATIVTVDFSLDK
jgi:TonB family protein